MTEEQIRRQHPFTRQCSSCGANIVDAGASTAEKIAILECEILRLQADAFWRQVGRIDDEDSCWAWTGYTRDDRYGQFTSMGRKWLAHRASWTLTNGPIPAGLHMLHRCDVPECVRPSHLFLGTHLENVADMVRKGRNSKGERHSASILAAERDTRLSGLPGERNPSAILTDDDVYLIRDSVGSSSQVAPIFGVSPACIRDIRSRRRWRHLPEMPVDEASTLPTDREDQLDLSRHKSHFATCANADQHRRSR